MKIEFYTKDVYGKTNIYIKDEKVAHLVSMLTGKRTVDAHDLAALQALGHEVSQVAITTQTITL